MLIILRSIGCLIQDGGFRADSLVDHGGPHTPEYHHFFTSCFMILDMSSVPKKVPAEIFLSHRVRFRICST